MRLFEGNKWELMQPIAKKSCMSKMQVVLLFGTIIVFLHNQLLKDRTFVDFWQNDCVYRQVIMKYHYKTITICMDLYNLKKKKKKKNNHLENYCKKNQFLLTTFKVIALEDGKKTCTYFKKISLRSTITLIACSIFILQWQKYIV